jgi:DMSO/TMAO reductase YedYZ molybdopterin-dependent catalytic subunit
MWRKMSVLPIVLLLIICLPLSGLACRTTLTISGLVKHPFALTVDELAGFEAITVRTSDITKAGEFHGVFTTRGVPLKSLLEVAAIQKEGAGFNKHLDLAIVVRNKAGKKVTLSWGEVFYRNPGDVTIAFSSVPVTPHKGCTGCHTPDFYQPYMDQLSREICLPRLVIAKDFESDRSLEGIVNIEVVNLNTKPEVRKKGELFSPQLTVSGAVKKPLSVKDITAFQRATMTVNMVGDGRGFHGRKEFEGVPLVDLLSKAGIEADLSSVVVVSAPDGYRSLLSYGELFLSTQGNRIIIADRANGTPLQKNGKFLLVLPDDLSADRSVKAVEKIEVISFN